MNTTTMGRLRGLTLIGDRRSKFAWLPVPRYLTPSPYNQQDGWYWLAPTVQTRTGFDGWIAYVKDNPSLPVYHDRTVGLAIGIALMVGYVATVLTAASLSRLFS